jgi:hypothetical protein
MVTPIRVTLKRELGKLKNARKWCRSPGGKTLSCSPQTGFYIVGRRL